MKAAIVQGAGQGPVYGDFAEPVLLPGESRVTVTAAALSHLALGRASGTHYSAAGAFPFVAGIDGVGRLDDGKRVYFLALRQPYGSMAEHSVARAAHCIPLPDDLDDVTAAAIANPGMSSWAALTERAKLQPGETVLINGATGTSGRLAVQIAKHLGAKKVIVTGRNAAVLDSLKPLGADVTIPLVGDATALEGSFKQAFADGVDVVLDYLWGTSAAALLSAGAKGGADTAPIRFVQIGSLSSSEIPLSAAALRSSAIVLMGSGLGSVPLARLAASIDGVFRATVPSGFQIATSVVPLAEVERAWSMSDSSRRTVFTV
jgi:NADPH:quinone reductase-like Zn-dependent oxidoreductase